MHIHIHTHNHSNDKMLNAILELLLSINKNVKHMNSELEAIKQKLAEYGTTLDAVKDNVTGIKQDSDFLKKKLQDLIDSGAGASAADIEEIFASVNGLGDKITGIADATASLNAETDSSGSTPPQA